MGVRTANVQPGNIGETLTGLAEVIHGRRDASPEESYTARLLTDVEDELLKKLAEEASEVKNYSTATSISLATPERLPQTTSRLRTSPMTSGGER